MPPDPHATFVYDMFFSRKFKYDASYRRHPDASRDPSVRQRDGGAMDPDLRLTCVGMTGSEMEKVFSVYILASRRNGTLYIGVTSDLAGRVWQHKTKAARGFTSRYGCDRSSASR
jgi:hypothetical protein